MKSLLTIIILILTLKCPGQFDKTKISGQTKQIVSKIEKVNELMGSAVYNAGIRPEQYNHFTKLLNRATQEELLELTNHPNGVVRCYAFWAYTYCPSAQLLPIVMAHLADTVSVNTQFGCIGGTEKVGDFFINLVTPLYVDLDSKKLSPFESDYLDSILVYTPNTLYAKQNALDRTKLSERFYARVRELVLQENNQSALVILAKFKKEQDIPLILHNKLKDDPYNPFFYTYKAISEFPHNDFLPLLKKSLYEAIEQGAWSGEWAELYAAIASFKNDSALQLLKLPFTETKHKNIREYHINFIFEAVQNVYTPIYNELLWNMWENEKKINKKVFRLLYPTNPDKAFQLTKKTLQNADDFYYLHSENYGEDEERNVNLLDLMLDTVIVRDRPFAIVLINKNIREINVHQFPIFADKALKLKDSSFVTALFNRLEKEDNAYIYLKAAATLIAYNNNDINRRLMEVYKRNPGLRKDWGGQEFRKLLKENGIR